MEIDEIKRRVNAALVQFTAKDIYLLKYNLSERCIASRFAFYLQAAFPEFTVDVEYNRIGKPPKRLGLPDECANYRDLQGKSLVVPDVIIHKRGPKGQNLMVLEFKKTTNPEGFDCDRKRVCAFKSQLGYHYGALVECETRKNKIASIQVIEWLGN